MIKSYWTLPGLVLAFLASPIAHSQDILPDLTVSANYLADNEEVDDVEEGRLHLRLASAIVNEGAGPLEVATTGVDSNDGFGHEFVNQRIYQEGGGTREQDAGSFLYDPVGEKMLAEGWSQYRIREILAGNGVGDVLASGEKPTFCLRDSVPVDTSLPGYMSTPGYRTCASPEGISIGWADLYPKYFEFQWIDITDVPPGEYWLEAEVDSGNNILESDESNNITRIKVTITGTPDPPEPPNPFEALLSFIFMIIERILSAIFGGLISIR